MFTGLIETTGRVVRLSRRGDGARLGVRAALGPLVLGESVSVSGACLTVAELSGDGLVADVSAETLARTTLGELGPGDAVNLERATRLGDRMGGHIVTGHVDDVGRVTRLERVGEATRACLRAPARVMRYLAPKGSVAIDGVSLTVNELDDAGDGGGELEVMLVPHTLAHTTLAELAVGRACNLEADVLSRYVARHLAHAERHEQRRADGESDAPDATDQSLLAKLRAGGFL